MYLTWSDSSYRIGITHDPLFDLGVLRKKGYKKLKLLTQALPVGIAQVLWQQISTEQERLGKAYLTDSFSQKSTFFQQAAKIWLKEEWYCSVSKIIDKKEKLLQQNCHKFNISLIPPQEEINGEEVSSQDSPVNEMAQLKTVLAGRLLFLDEIERALLEQKVSISDLENTLQLLFLNNEVEMHPGVTWRDGQLICLRCGGRSNIKETRCFECGITHCYYCEDCMSMGESRLCKPLYGRPAGKDISQPSHLAYHKIELEYQLTRAQKDAAIALDNFVAGNNFKQCLVWAVCGAGKTDVVFWAIASIINSGGKVLFVSPRKDVISELLPRFEQVFPNLNANVLHGGQRDKYGIGQLTLATTHQTIRFYKMFDLVVLDEVDAYPYHGNKMLQYAVARATKGNGKTIYLTATPSENLYKLAESNTIELVRIPSRHHGQPLPVPQIILEKTLSYKINGEIVLPANIIRCIHRSVEGDLAQLFVFVPNVFLAKRVGEAIQEVVERPPFNDFSREWVQYSHSKDPQRDEKRLRFSRGDFPIFVTTTIMERGITVPRSNVLVLFAEKEQIFDAGTLVQMAGRAGRSSLFPHGKVWFAGAKTSEAMKNAVNWIIEMNQEAFKHGYFSEELYAHEGVKLGGYE